MNNWTLARIESLITDQVEESLTLEYKAADALKKDDPSRNEISKDVSAMANSAGGVIIYGVREFRDKSKRHLPEAVDPIRRENISKEWIEHVINNIKPRVADIKISPVSAGGDLDAVIYVVEIPQSYTAHQATDFRYYRRYNFETIPMLDYEIRDVMGRRQHPHIEVSFTIELETYTYSRSLPREKPEFRDHSFLCAKFRNAGRKSAALIFAKILVPPYPILESEDFNSIHRLWVKHEQYEWLENMKYSKVQVKNILSDFDGFGNTSRVGAPRAETLLPDMSVELARWRIKSDWMQCAAIYRRIVWECFADDSQMRSGEVELATIPFIDKRLPANERNG